MFSSVVQPGTVSLFSSTGTDPLALFSTHVDAALPADSFIHLVHDSSSLPAPAAPAELVSLPLLGGAASDRESASSAYPPPGGHALDQTVLHIQSPTLRTTFVRAPPAGYGARGGGHLAVKHPWVHLQVRSLGREWAFEIGLVDTAGREGVLRCSTFQTEPRLKYTTPPLLHIPLTFPSASSRPLTAWTTIAVHLPSMIPHFSSPQLARPRDEDEDAAEDEDGGSLSRTTRGGRPAERTRLRTRGAVPAGGYSHMSYIKVYATCRLKRIWLSETAAAGSSQPWEFQLYGME